jgi:hypothetical protein
MTYRIENKYTFQRSDFYSVISNLIDSGGTEKYPQRDIRSLYFDTLDQNMHTDSEEGLLPRKKIRIRSYGDGIFPTIDSRLETKISSVEGRFKTSLTISQMKSKSLIKSGIVDSQYGQLFPSAFVEYKRKYFSLNKFTVTLDWEIVYKVPLFSRLQTQEQLCVLEVKGSPAKVFDQDWTSLGLNSSLRFSKYCRAIESNKSLGDS